MPNLPVFPGISGGTTKIYSAQFPVTRSQEFQTIVSEFQNGSEQRFQDRSTRASFILQFTALPQSDRQNIDTFIQGVNGSAGQWYFNINDPPGFLRPYGACQFEDETFSWQENKEYALQVNGSIRFRVTTQQNLLDAIPNADNVYNTNFPTVANGQRTGYPFIESTNFQIARVDLPTGNRVAYPSYGSGFPNYPTRPLYSWTLTFGALADADLVILEAHYLAMSGRYTLFGFTNPKDLSYYPRVRYDMDSFKVTHIKAGLSSVTIKLAESFGANWVGPSNVPIFGTGIVTPGVLGTLSSVDGHWTQNSQAAIICIGFDPTWLPNSVLSQWIGPLPYGTSAPGVIAYDTTFWLGGHNPNTALLSGDWACSGVGFMYLNGALISSIGGFGASKLSYFSATTGFAPGNNTLQIVVTNSGTQQAGARCAVRCIAS